MRPVAVALVSLVVIGCARLGDGARGELAIGFDAAAVRLTAGRELSLAIERPLERGHFCLGNCDTDARLSPISALRVVSSAPSVVEVLDVDLQDGRAPLVHLRLHRAGQARLEATATSGTSRLRDDWILRTSAPMSGDVIAWATTEAN
jgi:hypothetical protein